MFTRFDPSTLKVGDTAFIQAAYGNNVLTGKVVKITATGQVTVEFPPRYDGYVKKTRFDARGREIGASSRYYAERLISEESYKDQIGETQKRVRTNKASNAADELTKMFVRHGCDKEAVLAKIDELRALVEAI